MRRYTMTGFRPQSPDELLQSARDVLPCIICGRRHTSRREAEDYHEAIEAELDRGER